MQIDTFYGFYRATLC